MAVPSGANTCVIPSFLPMMPVSIFKSSRGPTPARAASRLRAPQQPQALLMARLGEIHAFPGTIHAIAPVTSRTVHRLESRVSKLLVFFPERLDLNVDAGR